MTRKYWYSAPLAAAALIGAAPPKNGGDDVRPAQIQSLVDCQKVADTSQRLTCYDREVSSIVVAEKNAELIMMDKAQVRATRRTLFGLSLPDLDFFGGTNAEQEDVAKLEGTLKWAQRKGDGKWTFELDNGAKWTQIDGRELSIDPAAGQPISIRRAALGSYMANVNKQTAIRVRRVL